MSSITTALTRFVNACRQDTIIAVRAVIVSAIAFAAATGCRKENDQTNPSATSSAPSAPEITSSPPDAASPIAPGEVSVAVSRLRPVLLRVATLKKGPPTRVLVEPAQLGGYTLTTPGAAFRLSFGMGSGLPEPAYRSQGSEFVFKGPIALAIGKILLVDERFPVLFKIADDGGLTWVAGPAVFQDGDKPQVLIKPAESPDRCLELLASNAPLDREEGAYSLRYFTLDGRTKTAAIEALTKAVVDDPVADVRRTAAEGLMRIGDASVAGSLHRCAQQDADAWCREVAAAALAQLAPDFQEGSQPPGKTEDGVTVRGSVGGVTLDGRVTGGGLTGKGAYWVPQLF